VELRHDSALTLQTEPVDVRGGTATQKSDPQTPLVPGAGGAMTWRKGPPCLRGGHAPRLRRTRRAPAQPGSLPRLQEQDRMQPVDVCLHGSSRGSSPGVTGLSFRMVTLLVVVRDLDGRADDEAGSNPA